MDKQKTGSIDINTVILAHKFTCPYYNIPKTEFRNPRLLSECGAKPITNSEYTECNGDCWYMKHFIKLLNSLVREAKKEAQ